MNMPSPNRIDKNPMIWTFQKLKSPHSLSGRYDFIANSQVFASLRCISWPRDQYKNCIPKNLNCGPDTSLVIFVSGYTSSISQCYWNMVFAQKSCLSSVRLLWCIIGIIAGPNVFCLVLQLNSLLRKWEDMVFVFDLSPIPLPLLSRFIHKHVPSMKFLVSRFENIQK